MYKLTIAKLSIFLRKTFYEKRFSNRESLQKGTQYRTVKNREIWLFPSANLQYIFGFAVYTLCSWSEPGGQTSPSAHDSPLCEHIALEKRKGHTSMRLANKVVLITGSARGMGKVAAELFAREGASIVVTDVAQQEGEGVVRDIRDAGGKAIFVAADVTRSAEVERLVETAIAAYGHIDVLYNNAGIMPNADGSILDITDELWDTVMLVNLKSVFLCSKYVIPHMIKQGKGSIINISSMNALLGCVVAQDAYTASKGGILALTKSLAVQYGRQGIRCNAICPGPINTGLLDHLWTSEEARMTRLNRIPAGRFGLPEDVVYLALYLASDESTWTNGAQLNVDGGITSNYF
jgi:NAD(P)-dependent dehydrogenase (short-subunit alcohol dehydrogenase family)